MGRTATLIAIATFRSAAFIAAAIVLLTLGEALSMINQARRGT